MTLTRNPTASWRMEGISAPRAQSPTATRCLICSMIWRYIGRPSAFEMIRSSLCISIYSVYTVFTGCQWELLGFGVAGRGGLLAIGLLSCWVVGLLGCRLLGSRVAGWSGSSFGAASDRGVGRQGSPRSQLSTA